VSTATQGTVAGRPQPQTTAEQAGGPFVRHAPDGRRAMYVDTQQFGGLMARPMVSSPGWNKGYRVKVSSVTGGGTGGVISAGAGGADAPFSLMQLVQMKDAFGTQLLTGPGYNIAFEVPLFSGQFGTDDTRDVRLLPSNVPMTAASGAFVFPTYFPFEFAKGYGVISGANAALLPVLQVNLAPVATLFSTPPSVLPTLSEQVDSDFYWLPNVPTDPPGIGTTCQWIYQPCNPTIPSGASQLVQLPRLGGYLTALILELRGSTGLRTADTEWPTRPKVYVDGVPLIDTDIATWFDDIAISFGVGVSGTPSQTAASTPAVPRPNGVLGINRKTSLSQRDLGLLDTGEIFLSTNPGTQIEMGGFPWGTAANAPNTLNALVGQVVPSGALVRGLPEV
jgi:hypothetical protein